MGLLTISPGGLDKGGTLAGVLALVNLYGLSVLTIADDDGGGGFVHMTIGVALLLQALAVGARRGVEA